MMVILDRNKVTVNQLLLMLWERVVELSRKAEIDQKKNQITVQVSVYYLTNILFRLKDDHSTDKDQGVYQMLLVLL
jgi:hypothetical protein